MAYCTEQDLIDRFGERELIQLTDRQGLGAIDTAVLAQALADAEAEIEAYLGSRYPLPLSPVPPILVAYGCDLTRYRLYGDQSTDLVAKRYEDAIKFLRMVAEGRVSLGAPAPTETKTAGSPEIVAPDRLFSRDSLAGY